MTPDPAARENFFLEIAPAGTALRLAARRLRPEGAPEGAPTLVFLHEALGSIGQWKGFPEELAAASGLPALVYERQGHGRSTPLTLPRDGDYLRHEARVVLPAVLQAAGIERPLLLARISQTMAGVTEANLTTGQERREERIGNTVERLDAACRQRRPALRVASGSPPGASKPSTVVPATLFELLLPGGLSDAMTPTIV